MKTPSLGKALVLLAITAGFTGCSSMAPGSRPAQVADADLGLVARQSDATASSPLTRTPETPTLEYQMKPQVLGAGSHGWLDARQPFQWTKADSEGFGPAPTDAGAGTENPFSWGYWKLVGQDFVATVRAPAHWDTRDWLVFGGVAVGVGTVAAFDEDIQRAVQRNRNGTVNSIFNAVEPFGNEYAAAVLGAFYAGGELFKDSRAKIVALDGASASIIASGLLLQPLKYGIGRSRPGASVGAYDFHPFGGADSFPSGHATEAFALATVIAEHYDSLWIKLSAYGVASAVGYARLNNNAHWASDVLAGAALGTFVGHVVVHYNLARRNISLAPVVGPGFQGAQFTLSF